MPRRAPRQAFTPPPLARRAVLPGAALLGLKARNALELERLLERGLSPSVIPLLKEAAAATATEIAPLLGLSPATLQRRLAARPKRPLGPRESERAFRLARLLERATQVIGSSVEAQRWLREPLLAIGNRTPLEAARTETGAELVLQVLGRLEEGVYS